MKTQFFVGMGLGAAAVTAAVVMMNSPKEKRKAQQVLKKAEDAIQNVTDAIGG